MNGRAVTDYAELVEALRKMAEPRAPYGTVPYFSATYNRAADAIEQLVAENESLTEMETLCHKQCMGWKQRAEAAEARCKELEAERDKLAEELGAFLNPGGPEMRIMLLTHRAEAAEAILENPTPEMKLAGARSIGQTMGQENHTERAAQCWREMTRVALEKKQ